MPNPFRSGVGQPSLADRELQRRIARGEVAAPDPTPPPVAIPDEWTRYPYTYFYSDVQVSPPPRVEVQPAPRGAWDSYLAATPPDPVVDAATVTATQLQDALERTRARVREAFSRRRNREPNVEYDRHGNPRRIEAAPDVPETPPHLEAAVPLTRQHFDLISQEIRALRPTQEGRAAAAQHSTLNKLAYKLATLFEGDNSSFDRARWLEACGVQTAQRNG